MTLRTPAETQPARPTPRWGRRAGTAVLAAVLVCAPLPALAQASGTGGTVSATRWEQPGEGWSSDAYGASSQSVTVDSDPATAAESRGVVLIDTTVSGGTGAGTGVVLTAGGEVLTNYHVVEGATRVSVTIASTGRTYTASVVGHSSTADVALLQLKGASGLTPAALDDDNAALGDDVTAVGNAGGTGTLTAADGEITALESTITTASEYGISGETLRGLIETDADVVAGDSGGPLIDDEGEVVGIDTAASSGREIDGYAIPIEDALAVVAKIRSGDDGNGVQVGAAGFLGVELGEAYGYSSVRGALVAGVLDGSAAAAAGLSAGDVITAVDGQSIGSTTELSTALAATDAGDRVKITWTGADGVHHSTVTLGSNPAA